MWQISKKLMDILYQLTKAFIIQQNKKGQNYLSIPYLCINF